jgi:hypothetical protein
MATDTIAEVVETEAQPTDGNVEVLETETPPAKNSPKQDIYCVRGWGGRDRGGQTGKVFVIGTETVFQQRDAGGLRASEKID